MLPDKSMDEANMNGFGGPSQPGRGNIGMAVLAGAVVAIIGALIWGVIAYSIKYQFSIMAVLIGFAVGTVMARVAGARSPGLGVASAILAVGGCALGSLVAEILILLRHGLPVSEILPNLDLIFRFYPTAVGGLGFVFWAFAALYGYRIAMGMPMRWGFGRRRMRGPGGPVPGQQPYGTPVQPYGTPVQPYGTPVQPFGTPDQPYGAVPPSGYDTGQGYDTAQQPTPGQPPPGQPPPGQPPAP
jgi:hypothetical protein